MRAARQREWEGSILVEHCSLRKLERQKLMFNNVDGIADGHALVSIERGGRDCLRDGL